MYGVRRNPAAKWRIVTHRNPFNGSGLSNATSARRGVLVVVAMLISTTGCTIDVAKKGPDSCAVYAQAKVKLEDGSMTAVQAEPELRRALRLARDAAANQDTSNRRSSTPQTDWHDLVNAIDDLLRSLNDSEAFHAADDRAWKICAPIVGT
jgi:hypothetical protein